MSTNTGAQDIDVASIWAGVRRALPGLMICTLLFGGLTFAVFALMAKRYVAETQLTITAKPTNPFNAAKSDAGRAATVTPRLDKAAINTHVRALMAPDLLIKVGNELKLSERAEFNPAIGPVDTFGRITRMLGIGGARSDEPVEGRMLATMRKNLVVASARESRFISIQFTSIDPQLAADVANGIAKAYRNSLREIPVRETNEAVAVLLPKIQKLSGEVLEAEAAAKRFRAETDQLTGGGTTTQTLEQQRLATLNASLVQAEGDAAKSEARLIAARELATGGGADTLPEVQQSRIIQDLIAQRVRVERQVNEASAVLLAAHPRMRQLNADLNGLRRSIRNEIQTIVNGIAEEVRLGKLRTAQIRRQIAALKQSAVNRSGDEAKLRSLENTAKSKRDELKRLQRQLEDNRTVVDINRVPVESTIVSTARPSSQAVFPKKVPYTLLAMAATLMIGIALIISRKLLAVGGPITHDRRASDRARVAGDLPRSVADVDFGKAMHGPVTEADAHAEVAEIDAQANVEPEAGDHDEEVEADAAFETAGAGVADDGEEGAVDLDDAGREEPDTAVMADKVEPTPHASHFSQVTIPSYAAYLIGSAPVDGGFRQLIAGADETIDPSDEAIDLVAELSDAGSRVLLVDWSLDGKRLHPYIDIDGAVALVDVMTGRAEFDDVLVTLPDCNVHYIYAADAPAHDELLDEEALNLVLDALDEAYDHVVVVSRYEDARALFETIQGRFDAGMTVAEASVGTPLPSEDSFLEFEVADIEIVHYVRSVAQVAEPDLPHEVKEAAVDQRT